MPTMVLITSVLTIFASCYKDEEKKMGNRFGGEEEEFETAAARKGREGEWGIWLREARAKLFTTRSLTFAFP